MKKREADFGVRFRHWIRANPQYSSAYELKQTSKSSIPFSCLEEHQASYLMAIRRGDKGILTRVQGTNGEPDYIYLRNFPARIVIKFPTKFEIIDIETFLLERNRSKKKSLTAERAGEISIMTVKLKERR